MLFWEGVAGGLGFGAAGFQRSAQRRACVEVERKSHRIFWALVDEVWASTLQGNALGGLLVWPPQTVWEKKE